MREALCIINSVLQFYHDRLMADQLTPSQHTNSILCYLSSSNCFVHDSHLRNLRFVPTFFFGGDPIIGPITGTIAGPIFK